MNKVKPVGTIKVIDAHQCDLEKLVESLRDLLSDLHCDTFSCRACGWAEMASSDQRRCWRCSGMFCEGCIDYIGKADNYVCNVCDEEYGIVDRGDDDGSDETSSSASTSVSDGKKRKIDSVVTPGDGASATAQTAKE